MSSISSSGERNWHLLARLFRARQARLKLHAIAPVHATTPVTIMSQPGDAAMDDSQMDHPDSQTIAEETPADNVFLPPSVDKVRQLLGESYTHVSPVPPSLAADMNTECVLGVDEAGRGPVLGGYRPGRLECADIDQSQDLWCTRYTIYRCLCTTHYSPKRIISMTRKSSHQPCVQTSWRRYALQEPISTSTAVGLQEVCLRAIYPPPNCELMEPTT